MRLSADRGTLYTLDIVRSTLVFFRNPRDTAETSETYPITLNDCLVQVDPERSRFWGLGFGASCSGALFPGQRVLKESLWSCRCWAGAFVWACLRVLRDRAM